jgi:hypothetical protein
MTHRFTGFFRTFPSSGILETRKHDVSETGSVSETSCLLVSRIQDDGKVQKHPVNIIWIRLNIWRAIYLTKPVRWIITKTLHTFSHYTMQWDNWRHRQEVLFKIPFNVSRVSDTSPLIFILFWGVAAVAAPFVPSNQWRVAIKVTDGNIAFARYYTGVGAAWAATTLIRNQPLLYVGISRGSSKLFSCEIIVLRRIKLSYKYNFVIWRNVSFSNRK